MVDFKKFIHPNLLRGFLVQGSGGVLLYDRGMDQEMVRLTLNRRGKQIDLLFDASAIDKLFDLAERAGI